MVMVMAVEKMNGSGDGDDDVNGDAQQDTVSSFLRFGELGE